MSDESTRSMTGTEHYRAAEKLLSEYGDEFSTFDLAAAQVHATLALAAATALNTVTGYVGDTNETNRWAHIVGVLPRPQTGDAQSRACYFENHRTCAGCGCSCHKPMHTCVPFDPPERRLDECRACQQERDEREESEA